MFDKLLDFVINSVREQEKAKQQKIDEERGERNDLSVPRSTNQFWAKCKAGHLIEPCKKKASHHRERERYWCKQLEEAEKELREKGISLDVYDSKSSTYVGPAMICSGALFSGSVSAPHQTFQPRVDQKLLDNVKNCKNKMIEHRDKAKEYEELAVGYSYNPEFTFALGVKDIVYYGLGASE